MITLLYFVTNSVDEFCAAFPTREAAHAKFGEKTAERVSSRKQYTAATRYSVNTVASALPVRLSRNTHGIIDWSILEELKFTKNRRIFHRFDEVKFREFSGETSTRFSVRRLTDEAA